jgi:exodeoxyribonuclease VII small subunit
VIEGPDYAAMTFEQLVAALEQLTERMASGRIGIEETAELYEEAERIHGLAAERLARVQARIEARRTGDRAGPATEPMAAAGGPAGDPTDPGDVPAAPSDPGGEPASGPADPAGVPTDTRPGL